MFLELAARLVKPRSSNAASGILILPINFKAVLFVDADTILAEDYLVHALPYFNDEKVVAVAGHATTFGNRTKIIF
jgi:cellulose synthase/poly-beta-1,6-N-acetylglucosamine synthase-like glycosyltransferase